MTLSAMVEIMFVLLKVKPHTVDVMAHSLYKIKIR